MCDKIRIKINPLPHYNRYASNNYILCSIDFYIDCNGHEYHFCSETSDVCIKELLSEIDNYKSMKLLSDTELYYFIPRIVGNYFYYPYSFKVKDSNVWTFRYKRNQNDAEFDFECDISKESILSMEEQIKEQFVKIDWDSLGKTPLYTFDFPEKSFEWCYSAKKLCKSLNDLCLGKNIKSMYVCAQNYENPLHVKENYVNYYLGSELIIRFENFLLDLLIHAEGLFEWRVFENTEYSLIGPTIKFIEDGTNEFCDIGNVYGAFKTDYTSTINKICVEETKYRPWSARGFDIKKLSDPVELPGAIIFQLSINYNLSLHGWNDDFAIKLSPA